MTMSRYTYPHTIDNGAGERITFLRRVPGRTGDRLEVENVVSPGVGPPMHVHHHQAECLTVTDGRVGWQRLGEPPQFGGPGDTLTFLAGDPHRFWNAGEGPLRCTGWIEPADNIEYFLGELFASQRRAGAARPDPWDAAFLVAHFSDEITMLEMPAIVSRVVLPILVMLGRPLGKFARYADAPAPVRRRAGT